MAVVNWEHGRNLTPDDPLSHLFKLCQTLTVNERTQQSQPEAKQAFYTCSGANQANQESGGSRMQREWGAVSIGAVVCPTFLFFVSQEKGSWRRFRRQT